MTGVSYVNAGNGSPIPGKTFKYDVENRLVAVAATAALSETMAYDADGRRVERTVNGVTAVYVYDAFGQLAQEYGGLPSGTGGRSYVFDDHLGSTRMRLATDGAVKGWWDYAPFGEEIPGSAGLRSGVTGYSYGGSSSERPSMMYTGQVRDQLADGSGSGLDYFGARYLSGVQGRFTSPDAPLVDQYASDPQSWSLYSYVRNNPLRFVDPTGNCSEVKGGYINEGSGLFPGKCSGGTIGETPRINPNSVTVNDFEPPSSLLLAVAHGAQRAERDISTAAILMAATGTAMGGTFLIPGATAGGARNYRNRHDVTLAEADHPH